MENSYRYFENRNCKYYPCHKDLTELNCLFCYCPMYRFENCPGECSFIIVEGREIKDCSACTFPHKPENYDRIIAFLSQK